jgi:hypothetical protein
MHIVIKLSFIICMLLSQDRILSAYCYLFIIFYIHIIILSSYIRLVPYEIACKRNHKSRKNDYDSYLIMWAYLFTDLRTDAVIKFWPVNAGNVVWNGLHEHVMRVRVMKRIKKYHWCNIYSWSLFSISKVLRFMPIFSCIATIQ